MTLKKCDIGPKTREKLDEFLAWGTLVDEYLQKLPRTCNPRRSDSFDDWTREHTTNKVTLQVICARHISAGVNHGGFAHLRISVFYCQRCRVRRDAGAFQQSYS